MTVSSVSNVSSVYQQQQVHSQALKSKAKVSSEQPPDTVHLSPAAAARLKGADVDGDGDGR